MTTPSLHCGQVGRAALPHFLHVVLPSAARSSSVSSLRSARRQRTADSPHARELRCTRASAAPPPAAPAPPAAPKRLAVFVSGGGSNFRAIHRAILAGEIPAEVVVVVTNAPSCGGAAYAAEHGIPVLTYPPPRADPAAGLTDEQLVQALAKVRGGCIWLVLTCVRACRGLLLPLLLPRRIAVVVAAPLVPSAFMFAFWYIPPLSSLFFSAQDLGVHFVLLAGYLKMVPPPLVRAFPRAMLNIHPALLPAFGGRGLYGRRVHEAVVASGARFSGPTVHFVDEEYDTGPILAQAAAPVRPLESAAAVAATVLALEHALYPRCVKALCEGRVTWREDGVPVEWEAV
jgi:phosphoribosylglycinamide formyltransferase